MPINNSNWARLFEKLQNILTALSGGTPDVNDDYKDVYSSFWLKLFGKLDAIITAIVAGGGEGGNKQDKIPTAPDYHRYVVQQPAVSSQSGNITFTKNGDILTLPPALKDAIQQHGFISH
ncbi:MAG: hypothetical protein LBC77_01200 [Spirochaetaceae bacterium]|jgi:hypothetical protein|nr:hypothetical protein [Spirochaetaceae bacterium]